jgi:uncharacterized protein (DUF305 family)
MNKFLLGIALAALLSAPVLTFACDDPAQHAENTLPHTEPAAGDVTDFYAEPRMAMHKAMNVEPTGNADVDFAANMLPHHQGAVDMAKVELEHGTDPELRKLAQDIIDSQQKEIAFMKEWLAKHK